MELVIEKLKENHIPRLLELEQECFSIPWSESSFRGLLDKPQYMYLVALADGQVAGICGMVSICGEGDIDKVMVDASYRNQGIARRLLESLLAWGEQEGMSAYTLEVRVSNAPAIHLYERLGFVTEGIRPGFYEKPIEDAAIMWRRS